AYAALPGSPAGLSLPGEGAACAPARISRRLALVLGGAFALAVLGLLAVVPEENLPAAVGSAKLGVVTAASAAWHWDTASEAQQVTEELAAQAAVDVLAPGEVSGTSKVEEDALDRGVDELTAGDVDEDDVDDASEGVWAEGPLDGVECPVEVKEQMGRAAFWAVEGASHVFLALPSLH
ncbi:hypothetical protein JCM3770_004376, partial [Rhodotorula araucariae]